MRRVEPSSATLLISCPDQRGLVASIATFICQHGGNILHADQHQDRELGLFFMRIEWDLADFSIDRSDFERCFRPIADSLRMDWRVSYSDREERVAIFVSRHLHCLVDLLHRIQTGELCCKVAAVISNHGDAEPLARFYDVPYAFIPVDES